MYASLVIGCACLLVAMVCFIGLDLDSGAELAAYSIFAFASAFPVWVCRVLIDSLNHIVTAARKYTNDNNIQPAENE